MNSFVTQDMVRRAHRMDSHLIAYVVVHTQNTFTNKNNSNVTVHDRLERLIVYLTGVPVLLIADKYGEVHFEHLETPCVVRFDGTTGCVVYHQCFDILVRKVRDLNITRLLKKKTTFACQIRTRTPLARFVMDAVDTRRNESRTRGYSCRGNKREIERVIGKYEYASPCQTLTNENRE